METLRFLKFFTMLIVAYILAATNITAQQSNFAPAPGMDTGAGFRLTPSRALLWCSLFLVYHYLTESFLANTDPDIFATFAVNSDQNMPQNLFAHVINSTLQEELVPSSDSTQMLGRGPSPLSSSDHQHNHIGETTEPCLKHSSRKRVKKAGAVDKQMQVNETSTSVDAQINCLLGGKRIKGVEKECGITLSDLQQQFGKKLDDAAESLGVSRSTVKRSCRVNGIFRWPRKAKDWIRKQKIGLDKTATSTQKVEKSLATFQSDHNTTMSVKVSYNGVNVKFPLNLSSGKNDLEAEVEKRFKIQTGSYSIKYEDDEDKDWILITCDQDLHHGMHTYKTKQISTMKMLVEPLHNLAD